MKVTIITGTSQGLGQALARELALKSERLITVNRQKTQSQDEVICDLSSKEEVERAAEKLVSELTMQDDLLFVLNAGIIGHDFTVNDIDPKALGELIYTNVFGQLTLVERFAKAGRRVKLVAMTSVMGSISAVNTPANYSYCASKASLNLAVRLLHEQYKNLDYMLIDPGWMRTRIGGASAVVDPADSARAIASLLDDSSKWNRNDGMIKATTGATVAW